MQLALSFTSQDRTAAALWRGDYFDILREKGPGQIGILPCSGCSQPEKLVP
jgi:hypothetical protein